MSTTITLPFLAFLILIGFGVGAIFARNLPSLKRPNFKGFFGAQKSNKAADKVEPPAEDETAPKEDSLEHKITSLAHLLKETDAPSRAWFAMPDGKTIELGDTGFYITMQTTTKAAPTYIGYSPEHHTVGGSNALRMVKMALEALAREREEFAPQGNVSAIELKK